MVLLASKNRCKLIRVIYKAGHKKGDYKETTLVKAMPSRRKIMISSLAVNFSATIPTKIILDKSRHGSAKINARYQQAAINVNAASSKDCSF